MSLVYLSCISLEEACFRDDSHADQFDEVCGIRSEHWQADPPSSTSAALVGLFPKQNLWKWRWAHALNFFGRPWLGLFWVEPVLVNRCMVLATVLQLSSGSWQSSYSLRHLYVEQQFFFSDPQRVLYHEVQCWTSSDHMREWERYTPNLTHLLPIHTWPCNTNKSHDTGERKWLIGPNLDIST